MSSIMPSFSTAESGEIKAKLCDLSKDLDKFAPEHRSQIMVDRLRHQKLSAMISLAKAQHYLAETDVLIADYNLQAVADEFEHLKKERYNNKDMRPPQNSEPKEQKLVSSTVCLASSSNPTDVFCCTPFTPLLPAVGHCKTKEKGTETQHVEAHRRKSKTDESYIPAPKDIQTLNKIGGSEPTNKINEPTSKVTIASSKTHEPTKSKTNKEPSSKTKEAAISKTNEASSSKTKEAATSKTYEVSSSKTKEPTTSKTYEPTTSTKEAASLADTDLPAPELKRKKRKRSKSKSKDSKRHKSSHKHAASDVPAESTHAPTASSNEHTASLRPVASSHAPAVSSNVNTALPGAAASLLVPPTSSQVHALLSHAPNCDCLKSNRTDKEKTLLNTSISPIKKIVEAKGVQTDEKASKKDIIQTDKVKTLTKAVQTDSVIILHVENQTAREKSPNIDDEETLLLGTLPSPHSHSTAISLAKALQQIKSQKTSVLESMCLVGPVGPVGPDVSFLSQNDVLQKMDLIIEDEPETVVESLAVVKMEQPGGLLNTSTEALVNNLYKDIVKAKDKETSKGMKGKEKVTKSGLWKILDKC